MIRRNLLAAQINLSRANYQGRDMLADFYRPLEERVRHIPGVQSAGLISLLPVEASGMNSDIHIAGQPPLSAQPGDVGGEPHG